MLSSSRPYTVAEIPGDSSWSVARHLLPKAADDVTGRCSSTSSFKRKGGCPQTWLDSTSVQYWYAPPSMFLILIHYNYLQLSSTFSLSSLIHPKCPSPALLLGWQQPAVNIYSSKSLPHQGLQRPETQILPKRICRHLKKRFLFRRPSLYGSNDFQVLVKENRNQLPNRTLYIPYLDLNISVQLPMFHLSSTPHLWTHLRSQHQPLSDSVHHQGCRNLMGRTDET